MQEKTNFSYVIIGKSAIKLKCKIQLINQH